MTAYYRLLLPLLLLSACKLPDSTERALYGNQSSTWNAPATIAPYPRAKLETLFAQLNLQLPPDLPEATAMTFQATALPSGFVAVSRYKLSVSAIHVPETGAGRESAIAVNSLLFNRLVLSATNTDTPARQKEETLAFLPAGKNNNSTLIYPPFPAANPLFVSFDDGYTLAKKPTFSFQITSPGHAPYIVPFMTESLRQRIKLFRAWLLQAEAKDDAEFYGKNKFAYPVKIENLSELSHSDGVRLVYPFAALQQGREGLVSISCQFISPAGNTWRCTATKTIGGVDFALSALAYVQGGRLKPPASDTPSPSDLTHIFKMRFIMDD
ncbi:MAG: energy transducer TonB [Acetobacter cibinongensis]